MTIIVVVMLLALPAARRLWDDRKAADAENAIAGALSVARSKALQATEGEVGLLFYVDENGIQRVAPIAQAKVQAGEGPVGQEEAYRLAHGNVFRVQEGKNWSLYAPLRVVPRYVVNAKYPGNDEWDVFDTNGVELSNNDVETPPTSGVNQAQRHRNFFTMIFDPQGHLDVGRDVLIQDDDKDCNQRGDLTGLLLSKDCTPTAPDATPTVKDYFQRASSTNGTLNLDVLSTPPVAVPFLVVGTDKSGMTALNFPSVDGLLVYNDGLLASFDAKDKRDYLLRTGQPLYTNRLTGALIRGPVGESVSVK